MLKLAKKEHLIVPAHIHHLSRLRDFVSQLGQKYNFSYKFVNAFKLAIDEAATNIIKHAYAEENEGYITIQAVIKKNSLTIKLIDQGAYFDPKWAKSPDIKSEIERGNKAELGIFMMRRLLDKIDYQKTEAGNELSLTKYQKPEHRKSGLHHLASLPTAIKVKYVVHTIMAVTVLILAGFGYFYLKVDDDVDAEFIASGKAISKQIASQLSAVKPNLLSGPDGISYINAIMFPVFDERLGQIYSLSIENNSGDIVWSTIPHEVFTPFHRLGIIYQIEDRVFSYFVNDSLEVYEFEKSLAFEEPNAYYNKVHVILAKSYADNQVHLIRLSYIKITLIILGLSYILLAALSYLVVHPIRKLAAWVKAMNQGEQEDMDIDTSSEIGEIAQAFNDITQKFKESQKNLAGKERLEKQAQVAKDIQRTLLPEKIPELEQYEIEAYYEAAQVVGGDYYDFIEVDKDTLGIAIADVSGKGVPGSLVMAMFRTALRTEARGIKDAAEVLTRVNEYVMNDLKNGMFVTVFYLIFDLTKNLLNYASAGHTPLILYQSNSKKTYYLKPIGFPIGIQLPEKNFFSGNIQSETIRLNPNDTLLLYTDGVIEAMDSKKELYGEKRLLKNIHRYGHLSLNSFTEKLKNSIFSFTEGSAQTDDITFVAVRKKQLQDNGHQQEINENITVEAKFLSIEEVEKLLEVIRIFPDFTPAEIAAELNTKRFKFTKIEESKIQTELLRKRLHTKELREVYAISWHKDQRNGDHLNSRKFPQKPNHKEKSQKKESNKKRTKQQDRGQNLPQEELSNNFSPDIEADFVVGDFVDDLLKKNKPVKENVPAKPAKEKNREPRPNTESACQNFNNEDISDSLIDSLFGNYFPDKEIKTEELAAFEVSQNVDKEPKPEAFAEKKESKKRQPKAIDTERSGKLELEEDAKPNKAKKASEEESLPIQQKPASQEETYPIEDGTSESDFTDEITAIHQTGEETASQESSEQEFDFIVPPKNISYPKSDLSAFSNPDEPDQQTENDESVSFEESDIETEEISDEFTRTDDGSVEDMTLGFEFPQLEAPEAPQKSEVKSDKNSEDTTEQLTGLVADEPEETLEIPENIPDDIESGDSRGAVTKEDKEVQREEIEMESALNTDSIEEDLPAIDVFEETGQEDDRLTKIQTSLSEAESLYTDKSQEVVDDLVVGEQSYSPEPPIESLQAEESSTEDESQEIDQTPNLTKILIDGILNYKNKQYEDAIIAFKKILKIDENYKDAYSLLGNAYFRNDMLTEALASYEQLKRKFPEDTSVHENLGSIYARMGVFQLAVKEWRSLLKVQPERKDIEAKVQRALSIIHADSDIRKTQSTSTPQISKIPDSIQNHESMQADEKIFHSEKGNGQDDKSNLLRAGIASYQKQDFEAAIQKFKAVIEMTPDSQEAYRYLGNAYFRNNMLDKATQTYKKLSELNVEDLAVHENLGLILAKQGALPEAIVEWEKVLEKNPERKDLKKRINKIAHLT